MSMSAVGESRKILLTCWGSYGDVYPYIGIAGALKARGHRPLLAAPAHYRQAAEQAEIEFAPVGPDVDPADRKTIARAMDAATGPETVIRDLVVPSIRETYRQLERASAEADVL